MSYFACDLCVDGSMNSWKSSASVLERVLGGVCGQRASSSGQVIRDAGRRETPSECPFGGDSENRHECPRAGRVAFGTAAAFSFCCGKLCGPHRPVQEPGLRCWRRAPLLLSASSGLRRNLTLLREPQPGDGAPKACSLLREPRRQRRSVPALSRARERS